MKKFNNLSEAKVNLNTSNVPMVNDWDYLKDARNIFVYDNSNYLKYMSYIGFDTMNGNPLFYYIVLDYQKPTTIEPFPTINASVIAYFDNELESMYRKIRLVNSKEQFNANSMMISYKHFMHS